MGRQAQQQQEEGEEGFTTPARIPQGLQQPGRPSPPSCLQSSPGRSRQLSDLTTPFSSSQRFWKPTLHTLPVAQAIEEEVCLGIVGDVVAAFHSQS